MFVCGIGFRDAGDGVILCDDLLDQRGNGFDFPCQVHAFLSGKRRERPSFSAIISKTATWQVKALVDATEISGPACR